MATARGSAAPALLRLLALHACVAAAAAAGPTICDTAKCGKGTCVETVALLFIPAYSCTCDPGWSHLIDLAPFTPCVIPNCSLDTSCFDVIKPELPKGLPITDPCVFVDCGQGKGECVHGEGWSYQCQCHPGYVNMLNLTALPCMKNCAFGPDCKKEGIGAPPPPPPSPAPSGSVSVQTLLLQLLLLVSLALLLQAM
ncbi:hypothetical protein ACP4OV_011068 [Aristida adscensionis]